MPEVLKGRRILVVGASSGIGAAVVHAAAAEGALVVGAARRPDALAAVVADLADAGLFGERGDPGFARSADWRTEADRILRGKD